MSPEALMFVAAIITYPLLTSDPRGSAWAFLLGADLAIGLYCFARIVLLA